MMHHRWSVPSLFIDSWVFPRCSNTNNAVLTILSCPSTPSATPPVISVSVSGIARPQAEVLGQNSRVVLDPSLSPHTRLFLSPESNHFPALSNKNKPPTSHLYDFRGFLPTPPHPLPAGLSSSTVSSSLPPGNVCVCRASSPGTRFPHNVNVYLACSLVPHVSLPTHLLGEAIPLHPT